MRHNDLGTAVLLRELAARRFAGRLVLASSMVVYGEGRYACPAHGDVTPGPRRIEDLDAGRFEPGCPGCGARAGARMRSTSTDAWTRATCTPRPSCTRSICASRSRARRAPRSIALRYHNVYGPRMPRDTPYAGVASIFASSLAAGRAPRVFEDGGQLRDFVHVRDVARANVARAVGARRGAPAPTTSPAARPRSVLEMATALAAAHGDARRGPSSPASTASATSATCSPPPTAPVTRSGSTAREDFAAGMAQFARSPLRAAA